jgi:tRNA uridine 5-carbamoylmethylation protein Kti12
MSHLAKALLEETVIRIVEQLYPDMGFEEFINIEREVYNKIFDDNKADVLISKLDDHAHNLALIALDLMTHVDTSKIERKEDGEREEK